MSRWLEAHPWLGAMGVVGVVGAIIGVAILITLAIGTGGPIGESAFAACAIAPDFVDDALVAPRDAAYANCRATPGRDGVWEVSGRVDAVGAQNPVLLV